MGFQQQKSWKVLLIGDHCLDVYHYGVCERLSPEAPVPILKQLTTEIKLKGINYRLLRLMIGLDMFHQEAFKYCFLKIVNRKIYLYDFEKY